MTLFWLFVSVVLLSMGTVSAKDIYVSPGGSDANPGTQAKPVVSLEAAQALARKQKNATIWLAGGKYERTGPFVLDVRDSGTTWRARGGANVSITGGRRLMPSQFARVTDPEILKRLSPEAARTILQVNLRAQGIQSFGQHR